MHGLINSEILMEIIRELSKSDENTMIPSECVPSLAKGIEAQRTQAAIINRFQKVKSFNVKLQKMKTERIKTGHTSEENATIMARSTD